MASVLGRSAGFGRPGRAFAALSRHLWDLQYGGGATTRVFKFVT